MDILKKSQKAWADMPYWVEVLAKACSDSGLRNTAIKLGVSPAMVSLAINNKRKKLDYIQKKVEKKLMISKVHCPFLGLISLEECLNEQNKPYSSANRLRVQLFKACKNCQHKKEQ